MNILEIEKNKIQFDPQNPRGKIKDDDDLTLLMESIESTGQSEPILVENLGKDSYLVTEGHRRLAAIKKSKKLISVKAIVSNKLTEEERLFKQITIDSHRNNWDIPSRDRAWERLWKMGKYDASTFAKKLSVNKSTVVDFLDRMDLGEFVSSIPNVSASNITETKYIKDKATRKKVLKFANKKDMTRQDIRKLSNLSNKVSQKVIDEVLDEKISIDDANNMVGLNEDQQQSALMATKNLNQHKKKLKTMLQDKSINTEDVKEVRKMSELINDFQMEFFNTSSKIRQLSGKLQYMKEQDLNKYSNTQMIKILKGCLDELEDAMTPAIKQIKESLKDVEEK